jgi:hypothetical protein
MRPIALECAHLHEERGSAVSQMWLEEKRSERLK